MPVSAVSRFLVLVAALASASTASAGYLPVAAAQTPPVVQPPPPAKTPGVATLVRLPFPQDDGTLTPYTFELGYPLMTLVYDTLMWRDEDGSPQPWLANSVEPSEDGRRVTVRLADNVRWHDGAPVTSADVAFTFRFMGERFHPRFSPQLRSIERVDTPDPATATFVLRHPSPGFLDQPLSDVPILPAHLWQSLPGTEDVPDGLPVGSGPYRLIDHTPGASYRFEANGDYFRGPPAVLVLEVPVIRTTNETIEALERRRVDMLPANLSAAAVARLGAGGIRVVDGPSYVGTVLMFNLRRPPFDRPEARRAVSAALDIARVSRIVGRSVPAAKGYIHPASPWAAPEPLHVVDEAAARRALPGLALPTLDVFAPDNDLAKLEAGRQVALALRRAGISAEVKALPRHDFSNAIGQDGSTPDFGLAIGTAPALASYDPDYLRAVFGSDADEAPFNYSGYQSDAFDALADRIRSAPDAGARKAAVSETLRLLADDVPVVPLFFPVGTFTYRPSVYKGWRFVKGAGILDKRSFVEPRLTDTPVPQSTTTTPTGTERPWLRWMAAALLGAGGVLFVVAVIRR